MTESFRRAGRLNGLAVVMSLLLLTVSGCGGSGSGTSAEEVQHLSTVSVRFDPAGGDIPLPNNLLFTGSTDGTLQTPASNPAEVALDALDGFSTLTPITVQATGAIAPESLQLGQTVRVFQIETVNLGVPVDIVAELGARAIALSLSPLDPGQSTITLTPLRPLQPNSQYMVVLTRGIQAAAGGRLLASTSYNITKSDQPLIDGNGISQGNLLDNASAQALEPLRQLVNAQEVLATRAGMDAEDIIMSWTFKTQSVGESLRAVREQVISNAPATTVLQDTTADSVAGAADLFAGILSVDYYLDAEAALDGHWQGVAGSHLTQFNPLPVATSSQNIPLLAAIPKTPKPDAGYPVVIFQHGITKNRTVMLGVADSLAQAGFAVLAIDLPLHGVTGDETDGSAAFRAESERTFDLDVVDNATGAPGPDGVIDTSGAHFMNIASPLTMRDNLRQGVADLLTLFHAIPAVDLDNDQTGDLDASQVHFVGHSLGGIVGTPFLAVEPGVGAAVLGMAGGGLVKLVDGSPAFGPVVAAGLAAAGLEKGTSEYEQYLGAVQAAVDTVDPVNFAAEPANGRGLLHLLIAGDEGTGALPDQVVPLNVTSLAPEGTVPSPTAGAEPLVAVHGATQASVSENGTELNRFVRFVGGSHASLLTPVGEGALDEAVYFEIQTMMATFLASNGQALLVSDPALLESQTTSASLQATSSDFGIITDRDVRKGNQDNTGR